MDSLLVVTSLPDRESAEKLAVLLIERRLAACVNILAPAPRGTAGKVKFSMTRSIRC